VKWVGHRQKHELRGYRFSSLVEYFGACVTWRVRGIYQELFAGRLTSGSHLDKLKSKSSCQAIFTGYVFLLRRHGGRKAEGTSGAIGLESARQAVGWTRICREDSDAEGVRGSISMTGGRDVGTRGQEAASMAL
jgi:hypothetical protein